MGASSSSISELAHNEALVKLSGHSAIDHMDPFWNSLLSFSFLTPMNSADAKLLEESVAGVCKNFAINNAKTGNFSSLIHNFLIRVAELKASAQCEDNIFIWQTYNSLFIIRSLCKYFIEHLSEEAILQQFEAKPPHQDGQSKLPEYTASSLAEELINSIVELLVDVPVADCTYALHVEALNTILSLLSIQMFQPQQASNFLLYQYIMQGKTSIHACLLMKALLRNYCNQVPCPNQLFKNQEGHSWTASMANGLWSMVTLGFGSKIMKTDETPLPILANQSLLLILVLVNHCTTDRGGGGLTNPYREALFSFSNSQDSSSVTSPTQAVATFRQDYSKLYDTMCVTMTDDQCTLLLYLLLHQNTHMKAFILSRTDIDHLLVPILRILYDAQDRSSHHIYMALIVLLVFSEDEFFNKSIHEIVLKDVSWFKERPLHEITLGGLLILVVIRTILYNMIRMRDKYLHTNCLAALANMSSHFSNLHTYVAQRIVSLFAQLCRKHSKVIDQIRIAALKVNDEGEKHSENDEDSGTENEDDFTKRIQFLKIFHLNDWLDNIPAMKDLVVLEEVIRMVLEIINSCLSTSLHHNPNLIYTLLYKRDLFEQFRSHPTFQDIIQNIDILLTYFSSKLEQNGQQLSPGQVLEVIREGAVQFHRDRLKKFPELKFKYVEEESPEEFFIPYIWSLVYHASNMYFNAARIVLFSLPGSCPS